MEQDFEYSQLEKRLQDWAIQRERPFSGGFELTPYCNLSCKMCYVKETASGLPVLSGGQWLELGTQAAQAGVLSIILTGGEPLLHPDFEMIYSGLKKLGMIVTINTNGTLIDEKMADFLASDMPRRVNISLYGSSRERYRLLCGVEDAYDKTIRGIRLLQERGVPVKINLTPSSVNYPDLKNIIDYCKEHNLPSQMVPYLFEPISNGGQERQRYRLAPDRMADVRFLLDVLNLDPYQMMAKRAKCFEMLDHFGDSSEITQTQPIQCQAGTSSFWIGWNAVMNMCAVLNQPQADVLALGFEGAWEKVKKRRREIRVPLRCSHCSLNRVCHPCAAVCLHETGTCEKIAPEYCRSVQEYARLMATGISRLENNTDKNISKENQGEKDETEKE